MKNNKIFLIIGIILLLVLIGGKKEAELCNSPEECASYPCWFCEKEGQDSLCAYTTEERGYAVQWGMSCMQVTQPNGETNDGVFQFEDADKYITKYAWIIGIFLVLIIAVKWMWKKK